MRLWMVPLHLMCSKHLRGEHVETHMFVGSINKGKSMAGFIADGLLHVASIQERHDAIAQEMVDRGGNHESPLQFDGSGYTGDANLIDVHANTLELARRCPDCYDRIHEAGYELPFPRGGDKVFEWEGQWYVQMTGQWLTTYYPTRDKALASLERMRRNMTLRRQGRA